MKITERMEIFDAIVLIQLVEENSIVMSAEPTLACSLSSNNANNSTKYVFQSSSTKCKLETCLIKMRRNEFLRNLTKWLNSWIFTNFKTVGTNSQSMLALTLNPIFTIAQKYGIRKRKCMYVLQMTSTLGMRFPMSWTPVATIGRYISEQAAVCDWPTWW